MNILLYAPVAWPIDDALLDPQHNQIERIKGELTELVKTASSRQPDLVLLTGFEGDGYLHKVLESLCLALPKATVAIYQSQVSTGQLMDMMRVGVRDVLTDCQPPTVRQTLARAQSHLQNSQPFKSKVIGVITSKDGDWGSCVSANLGYCLAETSHARVLLIDLGLPFGDLDMYLTNQTDMKDLVDVSAETDRMDSALLDSMVHQLAPNLHLIVSPTSFEKVLRVQPEQIRRLIDIASRHYNYVVLDMGTALDQLCLSVLNQMDDVYLVASSILPSIRRVSQILKLLNTLDFDPDKVSVVVNRFDEQGPISRQEMEKVIGKPIRCHLALEHAGMQNSLLTGKAIMELLPDSKFAQAIRDWTSQITGTPIHKKSLWQRLRMK
jgi:pilus assembly protein CpaE